MDEVPIEEKPVDLYRETPVRYLGYANEVGEAFRSIIGTKWVNLSYGVATFYVIADTVDKTNLVSKQEDCNYKKLLYTASDTLLWQMLASVVIPGFTINRTCALANYMLKKKDSIPQHSRRWLVTAIGLITIPFIIKPIDHLVDKVLDETYRKLVS